MIDQNFQQLEQNINHELFGQQEAVKSVVKTLHQNSLFQKPGKLKAFFTFLGTVNSGKHYMCELIAKYNDQIDEIKTFYMDQYSNTGMVGYEEFSATTFINNVVEFIQNTPKSIIVFKDIEKADLQIQLALFTLFTNYDQSQIDLSNTIAVATTTLMADQLNKTSVKNLMDHSYLEVHTFIVEKLSQMKITVEEGYDDAFDKKLLSFINEHTIIFFHILTLDSLYKIASLQIQNFCNTFKEQNRLEIEYKDMDVLVSLLVLSLSPYLNARYVKQKVSRVFFDSIYEGFETQKNIEKVILSVGKKAKEFLTQVSSNEQDFLNKINRENKRVSLKWNFNFTDGILKLSIKDASFIETRLISDSYSLLKISNVTFNHVAGHKKVKKELQEIIKLLKNPKALERFHLQLPKGIILHGPQGMGKKLIAQSFAGELNIPYIKIGGSNLFDIKYIKKAYETAKAFGSAVVIFEDIDTQGVLNGVVSTMSLEPIINELDTLHNTKDNFVLTIVTITRQNEIFPEILQANRIDIQIEVPKLDMEAREFFLKQILQKPCEKDIDIKQLTKYISGMGGDELQRIGQEASLYAARKGLKKLTQEILLEQINIIKYGTKLENKQIRDIEISMSKTAYHEAGHAVLSYMLLPKVKIEQVTISPRREALGFVSYHSEEFIDATSKEEIFNDICVLLAGRIAKMEKYGDSGMETGAVNDLETATAQAYAAIAMFGMDEELGYINVTSIQAGLGEPMFSEKIEKRVLAWINKATKKTELEVKKHWKAIEAVALKLIEKEIIDGDELKMIIEGSIEK